MQRVHKNKTPKVYKNKKLNNANFGTYNLNDYQVFLQLISKIGGVDKMGKLLQPENLQREHLLTAKEFSLQFGVDLDSCYRVLKNAGKRLMESSITLEEPDLFRTQQINICSKVTYLHKEGSIKVRFTDDIMPYLAQVKSKFVLYNLKEVANFGSLYTTRLYELIQEFKDTGWLLKSIPQLREVFAVGKKFSDYNNFKKYTFAHAVDEINSQYEINLVFKEIKEGRKVVAIRFEFKPTFTRKGINPHTGQEVTTYIKPKPKPPTKKDDDDRSQVHPDQQELTNIQQNQSTTQRKSAVETVVKTIAKTFRAMGAEQDPAITKALEENTSVVDASLDAFKRRTAYIAEQAKIIAESLGVSKAEAYVIAKKDFEEEEAKLKPI